MSLITNDPLLMPPTVARGGNQAMSRTKGGSTRKYIWPWMRMVCHSEYFTEGIRADCAQAGTLIEELDADFLLADRAYNTIEIIEQATTQGMTAVIPPKKNRKQQRKYDKHLYKQRHLVENAFLHLKRWRGIATRCAKNCIILMQCRSAVFFCGRKF